MFIFRTTCCSFEALKAVRGCVFEWASCHQTWLVHFYSWCEPCFGKLASDFDYKPCSLYLRPQRNPILRSEGSASFPGSRKKMLGRKQQQHAACCFFWCTVPFKSKLTVFCESRFLWESSIKNWEPFIENRAPFIENRELLIENRVEDRVSRVWKQRFSQFYVQWKTAEPHNNPTTTLQLTISIA